MAISAHNAILLVLGAQLLPQVALPATLLKVKSSTVLLANAQTTNTTTHRLLCARTVILPVLHV